MNYLNISKTLLPSLHRRLRLPVALLLAGIPLCGMAERLPAFPGAEGFGRYAVGGRGGAVYHVTTLEDGEQPGTLRHAVMQEGPRTVVFDVAGTIFLKEPLRITNGNLTLAGQTAPGEGICIAGRQVSLRGDNTIVRYLRFRVGNEGPGEPDGLGVNEASDVIIDHCSISWSVDETCAVYGGRNTTVQWCISSESLRNGGHHKGAHGYGAIWGGDHASFHHNLLAHHESRAPRLGPHPVTQEREHVDMRNNVIYNWAGSGCYGAEGMDCNLVNNYYKPGPATPRHLAVGHRILSIGVRTTTYTHHDTPKPNVWDSMWHRWGRFYIDGNGMEGYPDVTADNWTRGVLQQASEGDYDGMYTAELFPRLRLSEPLDAGVVTTHTPEEAYELVLAGAGCSLRRDAIDRRIVAETREGTASRRGSVAEDAERKPGLIDVPADAQEPEWSSPWPELSDGGVTSEQLRDTDGDGIPDLWEIEHWLNPIDPADGPAVTLSPEGYTNLEVYLNSICLKVNHNAL